MYKNPAHAKNSGDGKNLAHAKNRGAWQWRGGDVLADEESLGT
jgi:hypothetical protein